MLVKSRISLLLAVLIAAGAAPGATARGADREARDWPLNGRSFHAAYFSPLRQIDASNVATLGLAWEFDGFVVRGRTHRGNEASPLVADGVMYFSGPWSVVYALDARSGQLLWKYDPQVAGQWARNACCDVVNRGVALWEGRVYVATLDGYLIALDAKTGAVLWRADTFIDRVTMNYSSTGAPRIAGHNIVIGNSGAEMGARGYVTAYDLKSGKLSWRFFTVPGDPSKGPDESPDVSVARHTWSKDSRWDLGGGGTVWDSMVYDPTLGMLYLGVGNGMPHPQWIRSPGGGDNLFLASIVALDVNTGRMRWYYQTTPGDSWDYTATQNMILADLRIGGKTRHVLMQAPKNGFFYVLDRITGELLSANAYSRVTWAKRVDLKSGKPEFTAESNYSTQKQVIFPSQAGGHNWMPMSYSETDHLVFVPAIDAGMTFGMLPGKDVHFRPGADNEGDVMGWAPPEPGSSSPQLDSVLKAWDPVAGKLVWQTAPMPFWGGGVLSTATGLVFQGSADGAFAAYEAKSGRKLTSIDTGTGIMAGAISYEIDGVQYVAVLAGFGGAMSAIGYPPGSAALKYENSERLLVFKLGGGTVAIPAVRHRDQQELPIATSTDAATLAKGQMLFFSRCRSCHASGAEPANAYPDLWNLPPAIHGVFESIVLKGTLSYAGMPSFSDALSGDDVRAIQAFIISDEIKNRQQSGSPVPGGQ
jgi:quinohemoprotein ethanol dehydrogenase